MKKLNFTAFIVATLICIAVIGLHIYNNFIELYKNFDKLSNYPK